MRLAVARIGQLKGAGRFHFHNQAGQPMASDSICLKFGEEVTGVVRSRMAYSLRVFAAVYGYSVVPEDDSAATRCVYGQKNVGGRHPRELQIPARYTVRPPNAPAPVLHRQRYADEDFYLAHGIDATTGKPDWLGEIFEWLSASLELGSDKRDAMGRIPYAGTVFHQQGISPFKPYAGLLMAWMENALRNSRGMEALPKAKSPLPGGTHAVVCSHDIDFYGTRRSAAIQRLGKNVIISLLPYRSPSFFFSNIKMATGLLRGRAIGRYIPPMLTEIESLGFRSTLFVVPRREHRRDPNYRIEQIAPQLQSAAERGFEVGVHASYNSLAVPGMLATETEKLGKVMGRKPKGSRQHWLRFERHRKLYQGIHEAGLVYDSSLGFAEICGFRNGANFAFPPYDFETERPCSFLEIPLVIMDGSLQQTARTLRKNPLEISEEILKESRNLGWGGISILWHNPMEAIQVPPEINGVFWRLAQTQAQHGEKWMSAEEFLKASLARYQGAGLLEEVHIDA